MWGLIDLQYIKVTADYSNAVLLAILPHVSHFGQKINLPLPQPITPGMVQSFGCDRHLGDVGGGLVLTNGYCFSYERGHVQSFYTPHSYFHIVDFKLKPRFYGTNRLSAQECVQLCRQTIRKLGYTEEQLYADLEPKITPTGKSGTNTIPRYEVVWVDPRSGLSSCKFEVNSQDGVVEGFYFLNHTLWRAPPDIGVRPMPQSAKGFHSRFQPLNPAYAAALVLAVLPKFGEFSQRLNLPVPLPVTTNDIASAVCRTFDDEPYVSVVLTNKYRLFFRGGMVESFDAPDVFFDFGAPGVVVKNFVGEWRMSEREALALARGALERLGYPLAAFGADGEPETVERPYNLKNVPRFHISWVKIRTGVGMGSASLEIDAEHKAIKSISIWCPGLSPPMPELGVSPGTSEVWERAPVDTIGAVPGAGELR